jgi:hypothetical protein
VDNHEKSDLSAKFLYGKFLNYLHDKDYVGANLAKGFLRRGKVYCIKKGYRNNKFHSYYKEAQKNDKYKRLREVFFYDGVGGRERKVETTLSETCPE